MLIDIILYIGNYRYGIGKPQYVLYGHRFDMDRLRHPCLFTYYCKVDVNVVRLTTQYKNNLLLKHRS